MSLSTEPQIWCRDGFIISTDKELLSISSINHAFGQDFMYWVNPVPEHILQDIINNSFCLGLYKVTQEEDTPEPLSKPGKGVEQIGFARLITDNVTFAYLTDVYVLPDYQGLGLGGWIIDCIDELLSPLPYLRWAMLRTSMQKSKESYEKRLGMSIIPSGDVGDGPVMMGRKGKRDGV